MNLQRLICTLVTIATMALAGCGGGGGGGGATKPDGGPTPSVSAFGGLNPTQMVADNIVTAMGRVADARPQAGSITQSSNAINNITQDRVTVTAEYGATRNTYSIRNGATWSIGTADGNPRSIPDTTPPVKGSELNKRVNGGTLWVDVYSDIEAPQPGTGTSQPVTVMPGDNVEYTGSRVVLGRGQSTPGELNGQPGTFTCAQSCAIAFQGGFQIRVARYPLLA